MSRACNHRCELGRSETVNWKNRTIWTGDNLPIMRGMNSESVDLIYLDPPFNSNANYAAPIGSKAAGAEFKDTWGLDDIDLVWYGEIKEDHPDLYDLLTATQSIHGDSMMSYLIYMSIRIMEMKRLLKPNGSIYLHCDPTASHYLKLLMDSIFSKKNYRNEITWQRCASHNNTTKNYGKVTDRILYYSKEHPTWNVVYTPLSDDFVSKYYKYKDEKGFFSLTHPLSSRGSNNGYHYTFRGRTKKWSLPIEKLQKLDNDGKIYWAKNGGLAYKKNYLHDIQGKKLHNTWTDIKINSMEKKERTGYPTQKPLELLSRIIRSSSNEGDTVLDPFCGCATACIASEKLNRNWVGIDISPKAAELVVSRMKNELGLFYDGIHRKDIPKRTDLGKVPRYNCRDNKERLYGIQGGFCHGCKEHFLSRNLTVDHIIPKSKGGTDHFGNLQLLCGHCNSTKGNRSNAFLIKCLTDKGWVRRTERVH